MLRFHARLLARAVRLCGLFWLFSFLDADGNDGSVQ